MTVKYDAISGQLRESDIQDLSNYIEEALEDDNVYVRKNGQWINLGTYNAEQGIVFNE